MNGWKKTTKIDWIFEKTEVYKLSFPTLKKVFLFKIRGPHFVFVLGLSGVEAPERKVYSNITEPNLGDGRNELVVKSAKWSGIWVFP